MSTNENFTKTVDIIHISEETLDQIVHGERNQEIQKRVLDMNQGISVLVKELEIIAETNYGWVKIENKDLYYQTSIGALLPNLSTFELGKCNTQFPYNPQTFHNQFEGYVGRLPEPEEVQGLFRDMYHDDLEPCLPYNEVIPFSKIDYETFAYTTMGRFLRKQFNINVHQLFTANEKTLIADWTVDIDGNDGEQWGETLELVQGTHSDGTVYYKKKTIETFFEQNVRIRNFFGSVNSSVKQPSIINNRDSYHLPVVPMNTINATWTGHLFRMLEENLIPQEFSEHAKTWMEHLIQYQRNHNFLTFQENTIQLSSEIVSTQTEITSLTGKSFSFQELKSKYTDSLPISHPETESKLKKERETQLLHCDTLRADLEPYNLKILTDPNRGHWDLWGKEEEIPKNSYPMQLSTPLVARNPLADIKQDGIIGIDFGTKSTVVVFQESNEHTMPLRVGTGKLSRVIEERHYENPTVLEFVDVMGFLDAYGKKEGRPNTQWEQVTSSHTAFENFLNSNSDQYYAFLYELKQWAGDSGRKIHLRDKEKVDRILEPYHLLKQGDFDPIEIYAYYLGQYINNMHNGIYMEYLLSYPVTYEKDVRDRIVASFTRGLKKSLPTAVLEDEKAMKRFSVSLGASEPVSYAICALTEYGLEPEVGEQLFYGVFDFGGGTTDFDFGLYRGVEEDKYDFIVESFGSSGDQFLGGENLLELLAFHVFKDNQEVLREHHITFVLPPQCKRFAGDEVLIDNISQEANLNMAQLKEKLRPLWERQEGYEEDFENGTIKVNLFNHKGESLPNVELEVTMEELDEILRNRIALGVSNFFQSLIRCFNLPKNTHEIDNINILLSGNSSKSVILREVMAEYMTEFAQKIKKGVVEYQEYFTLFPPLGTEEADIFMKEQGLTPKPRNIESPTCKTGVAFGLVASRTGGGIQLVMERTTSEEVNFPYYLGKSSRRKFKFITEPSLPYGKWEKFTSATEEKFTIYYSKLPTVVMGETPIADVERKLCQIQEIAPDGFVYVRATSPHMIELAVATEQGILQEDYLEEPVSVALDEG